MRSVLTRTVDIISEAEPMFSKNMSQTSRNEMSECWAVKDNMVTAVTSAMLHV